MIATTAGGALLGGVAVPSGLMPARMSVGGSAGMLRATAPRSTSPRRAWMSDIESCPVARSPWARWKRRTMDTIEGP